MQVISGDPQPAISTFGKSQYAATIVLLAAIYVVAARVGFAASAVHPVVSSAWPPSGISFAILLLLGLRYWPAIAIGAFLVNLIGGIPLLGALAIAGGNTLESVVGVWVLTRFLGFRPTLDRLRDVLALVVLGVASTFISATIGTVVIRFTGAGAGLPTHTIWMAWSSGDSIGILILTPLILMWATGGRPRFKARETAEAALLGLILIGFTDLLFHLPFRYVYAIFPFTIWATLRFGRRGAVTANFVVAAMAVANTVTGQGPFVGSSPINNLFELQIFVAVLALTTLILAAVLAEHDAMEAALEVTRQQSRQAQKMEAIGRLAGGVAHDFNNLLTVIGSCTDFVLGDPTLQSEHRADLDEVKKATDRATSLTRQLLAFGRTQVLRPSTISLNEQLTTLLPMLKRLFETTIEIRLETDPNLWPARADATQIEQVLLNLALNARDAMKDGGVLTFVTENAVIATKREQEGEEFVIAPGEYVALKVRDTGIGMDVETQRRVFEPFFTTKETGKGTGLGLATVYGIVKQSGGYITLTTSPGRGAEFRIFLPRTEAVAAERIVSRAHANGSSTRGTILLVEDEEVVRHSLERVLTGEGYRVLSAGDGAEALKVFAAKKEEIQLLLTDLVMPVMSGRTLAEKCVGMQESLKVIYVSGYTRDSLLSRQTFEDGTQFIEKPFTRETVLSRIAEVLSAA
ncbi:MAG TPA: MASE1 domain-containing protein [Gemmatimonadaceae bacterium]